MAALPRVPLSRIGRHRAHLLFSNAAGMRLITFSYAVVVSTWGGRAATGVPPFVSAAAKFSACESKAYSMRPPRAGEHAKDDRWAASDVINSRPSPAFWWARVVHP